MLRLTRSRSSWGAVAITAALLLVGCGVSGKTATNAGPAITGTPSTTTTVPPTTPTTADSSGPNTTETTLPGNGDTTVPSIPLGPDAIRRELIRIYKQSGFTNKEATCVANLIVKQNGGDTFDPNSLDFSKLTSAARKCFGADGVPGGSD
jgi:hypothetical protein